MKRGFTLIELLASIALLALLVLVGAAIVNSTSTITRTAVHRTEVREEARSVFDRMMLDLSTAVRFDTYEIQTTSSTNSVISLLSSTPRSGGTRLQRIDYQVSTNGLFRSVRNIDWNGSQDLSSVPMGTGELLSPAVGKMIAQTLMSDGTLSPTISSPSLRAELRPAGLIIWLAVANPTQRRVRNLSAPIVNTTTSSPWVSLDSQSEREGWRLSEKTFRLP